MLKPLIYKFVGLLLTSVVIPGIVVNVIKYGWKQVFGRKDRSVPPAMLNDKKYGTHHYIQLPGLKMHYVEKGDRSKPLMIFLHGFPDFWFTWRYQLMHFSSDYWCVAVDNRGYGGTDKPSGITKYNVELIADDIANLAKGLGRKKFILVGHDWGGAVGYAVCQNHTEMVECYIACNMPHPLAFDKAFSTGWKQKLKSWYMIFFQCPVIPELVFRLGDFTSLDEMFLDYREDRRPTKDVIECYKYNFSGEGAITGPLNYYRFAVQYLERQAKKTTVPVLQLWGTADNYLELDTAKDVNLFVDDCEEKYFEGVSHWVMSEVPREVNQAIEEYLTRRLKK